MRRADPWVLDLGGHVTEGPGFNVFVVRGGELFSPREGILMGITRQTVFELAAEHGLPPRARRSSAPTTSTQPTRSS